LSTLNIAKINGCVLVPTYNNAKTLARVLDGILAIIPGERVIVINDGCTDSSAAILQAYAGRILLLENETNRGKGFSLKRGLRKAIELGFDHAITIDSDGQHYPAEIPQFVAACLQHPNHIIMGSRDLSKSGAPAKSSFGNKFSNFWFKVETLIDLPDTQTGFRLYPLAHLANMRFYTNKFEFEIEIIVRSAWKNIGFISLPIQVQYNPQERVSHFRPVRDFFRISVLNTVLVLYALLFFYPKRAFSKALQTIKNEAIQPHESNANKALSVGFGIFMGIAPIWGFQLLAGIPLAILFRLNKVLFILAANISIPPMIPLILYWSLLFGQLAVDGRIDHQQLISFTSADIQHNLRLYVTGALLFGTIAACIGFLLSLFLFKVLRKNRAN